MSKTYSKLFKSEEITHRLLKQFPECKNNDGLLYILYLKGYTELSKDLKAINWLEFSKKLVSEDIYSPATIIRCRRRLQNKGYFNIDEKHKKKSLFKRLLLKIKKLLKVICL